MRYTPDPIMQPSDVTGINNNLAMIAASILTLVSRANDTPNMMLADFDMNGFDILNLGNPVTLSSFNWRGDWITSRLYNAGDAVFYNSSAYLCQLEHTSGTFITDLLAGKWTLIALGTKFQGDWVGPGTAYFAGDLVVVLPDAFYYCIEDHISTATFSDDLAAGYWEIYEATLGTMALQNANAVNITGGTIQATLTGSITADPVSAMQPANKDYVDAQIANAVANAGLTGDIKDSLNSAQNAAIWIPMNDGTLGNATSAATYAGAQYAALFAVLWAYPVQWIPMFTSGGVAQARGASAAADFAANMKIMMPLSVGRARCNSGTMNSLNLIFTGAAGTILTTANTSSLYTGTPVQLTNVGGVLPGGLSAATTYYVGNLSSTTFSLATSQNNLSSGTYITMTNAGSGVNTLQVNYSGLTTVPGQYLGEPTHQLAISELAAHDHPSATRSINQGNAAGQELTACPYNGAQINNPTVRTGFTGGNLSHNNIQPSVFLAAYVHI